MSYKLLEVNSLYQKYLDFFYTNHSDYINKSYSALYNDIMEDCFAECNFLHKNLEKLGVETKLIYYNDKNLQYKYYDDNQTDLFKIFLRQIKEFNPDILYISDLGTFSIKQLTIIKEQLKKTSKMVAWHFTIVNGFEEHLSLFDEVYTGSKYILNLIKPYSKSVKLLYHAFEPEILNKIKLQKRYNKLLFAGSIFLGEEIHNNRIDLFGELNKKNIDFDLYGNIYGSFLPESKKELIKFFIKNDTLQKKRYIIEKQIKRKLKPSLYGLSYYNLLSNYSICMNQHVKIAGTGAGNMRMFEVTGVGTCLITDDKVENVDLFLPDEEIVVYKNYDELIEKVNWLINNPYEAQKIAKKGQERTIREHNYFNKAYTLNNYIKELLMI